MKRRQRTTRLAILLAAAALGWYGWRWWTAPRIDPRLVGEWKEYYLSVEEVGSALNRSLTEPPLDGTLLPDGQVDSDWIRQARGDDAPEYRYLPLLNGMPRGGYRLTSARWSIRENRLLLQRDYRTHAPGWNQRFQDVWKRVSSFTYRQERPLSITDRKEFLIQEFTGDRMVLRSVSGGRPEGGLIRLRRIENEPDMN